MTKAVRQYMGGFSASEKGFSEVLLAVAAHGPNPRVTHQ